MIMNHNTLNKNMDMGFLDMDHVANMRKEFFINKDYEWWGQVKEGDVVVDVGTCVGMFSCHALDSGASKVYMIEPNQHLLKTAISNTLPYVINEVESKVVPCHAAIMNTDDHITHIYDGDSSGDFKRFRFKEFIEHYGIEKIDFLKIDCEGGEYDILTEENFDWIYNNVGHIAVEVHRRHADSGNRDMIKFRNEFLKKYEDEGRLKYQNEKHREGMWNDELILASDWWNLPSEFMAYFIKK
jgi:FkbM family methyltransferase